MKHLVFNVTFSSLSILLRRIQTLIQPFCSQRRTVLWLPLLKHSPPGAGSHKWPDESQEHWSQTPHALSSRCSWCVKSMFRFNCWSSWAFRKRNSAPCKYSKLDQHKHFCSLHMKTSGPGSLFLWHGKTSDRLSVCFRHDWSHPGWPLWPDLKFPDRSWKKK